MKIDTQFLMKCELYGVDERTVAIGSPAMIETDIIGWNLPAKGAIELIEQFPDAIFVVGVKK